MYLHYIFFIFENVLKPTNFFIVSENKKLSEEIIVFGLSSENLYIMPALHLINTIKINIKILGMLI